jgi:hypothetical protein
MSVKGKFQIMHFETRLLYRSALLFLASISLPVTVNADGDDTTLIHACVAKDGTMRIVSATTACKSNESALHWATIGRLTSLEGLANTVRAETASQGTAISTLQGQVTAIQTKDAAQDSAIVILDDELNALHSASINCPPDSVAPARPVSTNTRRVYGRQQTLTLSPSLGPVR